MAWVALGSAAIATGGTLAGSAMSKKKKGGIEYQPYSGYRPPRIDSTNQEILRPTQKQLFDIVMSRSKGEDVGYAPEWLQLNTDLIKSNLAKQEEDQVRDARGSLSAAGLSGNPRAIEATTGRIKRDVGRNLSDSMTQLSISDLERKNLERDVNTGRLQNLNTFNFGQENKAADFDLGVYNAEQGNRFTAAGLNQDQYRYDQGRSDEQFSDLMGTGLNLADLVAGSKTGGNTGSASANALRTSGTGVQPTSAGMYTQPLKKTASRYLMR